MQLFYVCQALSHPYQFARQTAYSYVFFGPNESMKLFWPNPKLLIDQEDRPTKPAQLVLLTNRKLVSLAGLVAYFIGRFSQGYFQERGQLFFSFSKRMKMQHFVFLGDFWGFLGAFRSGCWVPFWVILSPLIWPKEHVGSSPWLQ